MRATRREVLRKVGLAASLVTIPVVAGTVVTNRAEASVCAVSDDAELIRLGEEFDQLYAEWVPLAIRERELVQKIHRGMTAAGIPLNEGNIKNCHAALGLDEVGNACEALLERLDPLAERLISMPARTVAGLAVVCRVLRFIMIYPADDQTNWEPQCFALFQRTLEALAVRGV